MALRPPLLALLPLIAVIGCAQPDRTGPEPLAQRFATALAAADPAADAAIGRMDAFERLAQREDAAIAFAAGGRQGAPRLVAPAAGAAEAAGRVISPAFAALGDYAHVLAQVAAGDAVQSRATASAAQLMQAAEDGLRAVQASSGLVIAEPTRNAGLAGIAALADVPDRLATARGKTAPSLVAEAAPHVGAVVALLRAVIGPEPGQGTRGALRARREGLDAQQARFLASVASDRRLGPGERYSIFRSVAELRDDDPAQGTFTALTAVLTRLEAAHAALAGAPAEAAAPVGEFEAAVARLGAIAEASRRS